ncbi:lipoyl(octanoyl) transferase LipB [Pelagibacterales bacterium SAG-MED19]|nr:lipoyl(octanoyl) transferase LipB [Pelagibacterales bacterium SAG-MED19]
MNIEIKKSKKPIKYIDAIKFMESRLSNINQNNADELIWILEHDEIYTAGTSYKENEILDKSINIFKTNRGGKITYHGPGQLICYFVINLKKRNKDIRKFITAVEKTIIDSLKYYEIDTFADKKNIGIWYKDKLNIKKVAAIGIRVSKWIAYHGFSINIHNNLNKYKAIIPCGIKDKGITNLCEIDSHKDYNDLKNKVIKNFIFNLENLSV